MHLRLDQVAVGDEAVEGPLGRPLLELWIVAAEVGAGERDRPLHDETDAIVEPGGNADNRKSGHTHYGVWLRWEGHRQELAGEMASRTNGGNWPWPWRCGCGATRCWHGALLEGVLLAWEHLGDDGRPLPFEVAA